VHEQYLGGLRRTIESIGSVCENEDNDVEVQNAHVRPLPPGNTSELLVRKEEVTLGRLERDDLLGPLGRCEDTHIGKDDIKQMPRASCVSPDTSEETGGKDSTLWGTAAIFISVQERVEMI
jgi:hypothetical protein